MNRVELHSHTMYSNIRLLDCINKPIDLINRALELGLKGIAITDHESLSCHIAVNKYQKKLEGFKVILGNEIYLTDTRENGQKYYHCILLAKDKAGHKQLRQLSSRAWMLSYFDRGMERVPTLKEELAAAVKNNPGHLIMTTACLGGELSTCVLEMEEARKMGDNETAENKKVQIINFVLWAKKLFGDDFYFEVAPAANKEQIIVNKKIAELSKVFDVKIVIGSDAHYLKHEDRYIHEAFLNSKGGERETAQFYEYAYLQSEEDIIKNLTPSIVDLYEEMCNNSMEIYDKCEIYDLTHSQQIPKVDVFNYPKPFSKQGDWFESHYPTLASMFISDDKVERYWINECIHKLNELDKNDPVYLARLEEEADIKRTIGKALDTNMFAYPVTLQHYVDLFWECGSTVGAGRGSSCSGLNHYLLGVTQLDPIEWGLPFWRYLNKERFELGDIDIDIAPSKRPLILQRIREERGQNFLPIIDDLSRQHLGCTLIATFGTESSKSAVLTACRGYRSEEFKDGIDNDTAQYLSSLIPQERGFVWSISDVAYGNKNKDRKKNDTFINEVNKYPGLLDIMLGIEGMVSRRGSHASGVILFDEDPYEFGCFMKTPSGDIITQYDLHDDEAAGMTKYDFLVTSIQDKIVQAIKFLQEDKQIDPSLTLREVYNKYLHPEVIDAEDEETWKNIQDVRVLDLFQFDSQVGSQAAKKLKPSSLLELADANGLMRLMTAEKGEETPMDKYHRFKNNIDLWYQEMNKYGLTKEEQEYLKPHFLRSHGVPPSQEQMMTMLMDENLCGFSLKDANAARKIVGKKKMAEIPALKEKVMAQAKRPELGKYIWQCGIGPQMGYSFSIIHALAYSFIGYQSAYIATKWNPIYWNAACLVVNSESLEEEVEVVNKKEKGANYGKVAKALGDIIDRGINISLLNINTSDYGFKPDIANNRILYGLKALSNINSEIIDKIIAGRPYDGLIDFMNRCPLGKVAMINLIKAGAFDEIDATFKGDRRMIMGYYIKQISEPKKRLTLQNFNGLIQQGLVPQELEMQVRIYNFNKFLKANMKIGQYYQFVDVCVSFWNRFLDEYSDSLEVINGVTCIKQTAWDKIYQKFMDVAREWIKVNQEVVLKEYNNILFKETWDKYAGGSISRWEIDSLCFYHHPHELINVNNNKYGISNFIDLPRTPEVEYLYKGKVPIYKLTRIIGTVIAKDDNRSSITLLTTTGVVTVKFTRDYYAMFKRQISEIQPDGKKKIVEKGWFGRGNLIMVTGFRREDTFVGKTYARTVGHQLYKITAVNGDEILLQHERYTSATAAEEDYDEYN